MKVYQVIDCVGVPSDITAPTSSVQEDSILQWTLSDVTSALFPMLLQTYYAQNYARTMEVPQQCHLKCFPPKSFPEIPKPPY